MKTKNLKLILIPASVILMIYRFFQIIFAIDPATGFSSSPIFDAVLYSLLGGIFVFLLFELYYGRMAVVSAERSISKLICYCIIAFATVCEFLSVFKLLDLTQLPSTENSNLRLIRTVQTISAVLGILVGILLVFAGVRAISLSAYKSPNLFVCCLTILYFVVLLFTYYAVHDTMVTVSQNLTGLFFWMAATVFVYAYTRYLSMSKTATSYKLAVTFGIFGSICGLTVTVPQFICSLFIEFKYIAFNTIEYIMILPASLLILAITAKLLSAPTEKQSDEASLS